MVNHMRHISFRCRDPYRKAMEMGNRIFWQTSHSHRLCQNWHQESERSLPDIVK